MSPNTRNAKRKPLWNSSSWLAQNYTNNNGIPSFFLQGGYSFDLRKMAEDDYKYSVDIACNSDDKAYREWALNIRSNEYCSLNLALARDYWKRQVDNELQEKKQDRLNETLLRNNDETPSEPKRQKRTSAISSDLLYLDGLRESVGTVIVTKAKKTVITNFKTNYFTTLAMNHIIDISDSSPGSHLDLFNDTHQEQIIKALSIKKLDKITVDTTVFDNIIKKFSNIESNDKFLRKTIKEIEEIKNGNKNIKKVYLQILESWVNHPYLYDMNENNSEQDYISKLYAPIMENCFFESGIRLRWGDTTPPVCNNLGYDCKIDMRVTIPEKKPLDLSVVEYAKKSCPSKYYKDKVKSVLCSTIYHRNYQKENSNIKQVPAMLIARLENQILLFYQMDNNWCVVDKVEDTEVPSSVKAIKEGAIKDYVNSIKYFKDFCVDMKNNLRKVESMKAITKSNRTKASHTQKPLWFSNYKCEGSDDDLSDE